MAKEKFGPTMVAKVNPVRVPIFEKLENGTKKISKMVALGRDITLPSRPPKNAARVVNEATPEEYALFKHLTKFVELKTGNDSKSSKPDSTSDKQEE